MQGGLWANPLQDYWVDACQRWILMLDVLRQRGNNYLEQTARLSPTVLNFASEVEMDGRAFERPVNYLLLRIKPPAGITIDPSKRPFIVFDPRAGQGPGIGGMKHDSEIGEVLQAGHPCYFVGFLANPLPGQTIEDVCRAEARFVERVAELHPDADGKPCLIGNCQAGWQITLMSALRPDLVGPLMLAGSPLSYWAGVHGGSPMRYLGGLLGGTWLTALSGDLGNGKFDGAYLVANFESMKLSNTLWTKLYHVYSNVDTEPPRFLEFEKWWGGLTLLNAEEMQWIADQLFVGNKLSDGELCTSGGVRVDLRNIKSPIIVFCSRGDNITPPQQALDWILDLYDHDDEIVANEQTIIYTMHQSIGHLGIFVSGKVATKEDRELISCMDMIDLMPPGLYEAVITDASGESDDRASVAHPYLFRLEPRTLGDIRALGGNDEADERRFATVRAVSEANVGLYRTFLSPLVRSLVTEQSATLLRQLHPNRMLFELFSDRNPLMQPVADWAATVRDHRQPVSADNPLLAAERSFSDGIVRFLDALTEARDKMVEDTFLATYDSPWFQALVGLRADGAQPRRRSARELMQEAAVERSRKELAGHMERGSAIDAAVRAVIYIRQPGHTFDERSFKILNEINAERPASERTTLSRFKQIMREQYLIMLLDEETAVSTISKMLPADRAERGTLIAAIRRIVAAPGGLPEESRRRLARIEAMFEQGKADRASSDGRRSAA
jgi:pimeloyl-ACP methyl ester carboxylesterase